MKKTIAIEVVVDEGDVPDTFSRYDLLNLFAGIEGGQIEASIVASVVDPATIRPTIGAKCP